MNDTDVIILSYLNDQKVNSAISALTVFQIYEGVVTFSKDIPDFNVYSDRAVYNSLVKLRSYNLVKHGIKRGRTYTYFITMKGCDYLNEIYGYNEE